MGEDERRSGEDVSSTRAWANWMLKIYRSAGRARSRVHAVEAVPYPGRNRELREEYRGG